jgi:hypothetical protein
VDLFELLLIAVFLLFPLFEQISKRGKDKGQLPRSKGPQGGPSAEPSGPEDRQPASAADMLPEDLWAVLTGEKRERKGGVATAEAEPSTDADRDGTPWSDAAEPAPGPADDWPWRSAETQDAEREPVSLEYRGPEAYSLEDLDIEPVSLERPLPTPEERHRAFHARVDAPQPQRVHRRGPLSRALSDAGRVRQAVVLAEVLGPPRGLE